MKMTVLIFYDMKSIVASNTPSLPCWTQPFGQKKKGLWKKLATQQTHPGVQTALRTKS